MKVLFLAVAVCLAVNNAFSAPNYLGCWKDSGNRVLKNFQNIPDVTVEKCVTRCKEKGFLFAGLQFTSQCFCDNGYKRLGHNNCFMTCKGNNKQICGGPWANSVYEAASGVLIRADDSFKCYGGGQLLGQGQHWPTNIVVKNTVNAPVLAVLVRNHGTYSVPGNPGGLAYETSTGDVSSPERTVCVGVKSEADADEKLPGWKYGQYGRKCSETIDMGKLDSFPWNAVQKNIGTDGMVVEGHWLWAGQKNSPYCVCFIPMMPMENIAKGKTAFQSSETRWNGVAGRGVDGNDNPVWGGASCTHTMNKANEWWAVDLGCKAYVSRVAITNRRDCCSGRLANFNIGATDVRPQGLGTLQGTCFTSTTALGPGERKDFACERLGRYVFVQQRGAQYLTLCEVEVYGFCV